MDTQHTTSPGYLFLIIRRQVVLIGIWLLIDAIDRSSYLLRCRGRIVLLLCVLCSFCRAISFIHCSSLWHSVELLCVAAGAAFLLASRAAALVVPSLPFPAESISSVTGSLTADSIITDSGRGMMRIGLSRAGTSDGGEGGAQGVVNALGPETELLPAGTPIILQGKMVRVEEGGLFFMADGLQVLSPSPGILSSVLWETGRLRIFLLDRAIRRLSVITEEKTDKDEDAEDEDVGNALALCRMMLLGRSEGQCLELKEKSLASGTAHVLALSGSHLAWLSAVAYGCACRLRGRRAGIAVSSFLIIVFVFIAGPFPSLLRAAIMYFWGVVRPRRVDGGGGVEAVGSAFLLLLMFSPEVFSSAGCLMSFAAVIGMMHGAPVLEHCLELGLPRTISASLAASCAAMVYSAPFVLRIGGQWTPVGTVVTPPATVFSLFSLVCGLLLLAVPTYSLFPLWHVGRRIVMRLAVTSYRLMDTCMGWGADWTYSHPGLCTSRACLMSIFLVLTVVMAILYAEKTSERHKKEKHELEFRLRFSQCDQQTAPGGGTCDEQAVRTEFPSSPGGERENRRGP